MDDSNDLWVRKQTHFSHGVASGMFSFVVRVPSPAIGFEGKPIARDPSVYDITPEDDLFFKDKPSPREKIAQSDLKLVGSLTETAGFVLLGAASCLCVSLPIGPWRPKGTTFELRAIKFSGFANSAYSFSAEFGVRPLLFPRVRNLLVVGKGFGPPFKSGTELALMGSRRGFTFRPNHSDYIISQLERGYQAMSRELSRREMEAKTS